MMVNFLNDRSFMGRKTIAVIQCLAIGLACPIMALINLFSWSDMQHYKICFFCNQGSIDMVTKCFGFPTKEKFIYLVLTGISTIFVLIIFFHIFKIIASCRKRVFFSQSILDSLKKINLFVFVWALYELFYDTFATILLSVLYGTQLPRPLFCVGLIDAIRFSLLLFLILIFYLWKEAYKIKMDNDLVV